MTLALASVALRRRVREGEPQNYKHQHYDEKLFHAVLQLELARIAFGVNCLSD